MKLLKLTTAYPIYIQKFYHARHGLDLQSYAEQKRAMDYDAFGWADFWSHALRPLGYDVSEITINVRPMQHAWAKENGVNFHSRSWLTEIPYEQIKRIKPDILFVEDSSAFSQAWLKEIREKFPCIRLLITWCGAPYRDDSIFQAYDLILSCIPEMVADFLSRGHNSKHINHAFEPRILERIQLDGPESVELSFVGQIALGQKMHIEREKILRQLAKSVDIQIYSPIADASDSNYIRNLIKGGMHHLVSMAQKLGLSANTIRNIPLLKRAAAFQIERLAPLSSEFRENLRPSVFGLEMFQTLRNSKITFNNHIDASPRSASNMRMFEATGVGTCLVTDWKQNIKELFEPDTEVITYRTVEECVEKVKWLLSAPNERKNIAKAGQNRTLRNHTFRQRAECFDKIIRQETSRRGI